MNLDTNKAVQELSEEELNNLLNGEDWCKCTDKNNLFFIFRNRESAIKEAIKNMKEKLYFIDPSLILKKCGFKCSEKFLDTMVEELSEESNDFLRQLIEKNYDLNLFCREVLDFYKFGISFFVTGYNRNTINLAGEYLAYRIA